MKNPSTFETIKEQLVQIQKALESMGSNSEEQVFKKAMQVSNYQCQKLLLMYMKPNTPVASNKLAKKMGIKCKDVNRGIRKLISKGMVEPVGRGKGLGKGRGIYQLIN